MSDRFQPRGTLSPEILQAYAAGELDAAAMHDVELHLEADPLLRDAVDGLRTPGALAGLTALNAHRPTAGSMWLPWALSAVVVAGIGTALYFITGDKDPVASIVQVAAPVASPPSTEPSTLHILASEIQAAIEIPESLHIGHAATDRHALDPSGVRSSAPADTVIRFGVEPVEPRATTIGENTSAHGITPTERHRPSFQLVYLHDLKLIHPKEIHGRNPLLQTPESGVDARFANARDRDQAQAQERRMTYLDFMDEALEKFVQHDHKGCLEDLLFTLDQYPDDVNALFYAGLCCYNLGLNQQAERFFDRAMHHTFPVFDEEGDWYHALTLQRLGEKDPAQRAFERIGKAGGFYAARAQERIRTH